MAKHSKHLLPSHKELRRYTAGELSPAEQHRVEKAALQNEQTDDTVEGLLALKKANVDEKEALNDLRQRLHQRVRKNVHRLTPFYYTGAAAVVLAVGIGWWLSQKEELSEQVSSTIALQRPAPVIHPESGSGTTEGKPFRAAPPLAAVPESPAGKPVSSLSKAAAVPEAAQLQPAEEPLPTVALEEKSTDIPAPPTASAPLQTADSEPNAAVRANRSAGVAAAPAAALFKKSTFSAVNREDVFTIRGKVLTDNQEVLPGVALQIKDHLSGVSTDAQGNFVVPNVRKGDEITLSSVGFEKKQIIVNDSMIGPVVLKEDVQALSEVVVTDNQVNSKIMTRKGSPKNGWKKYRSYLKKAAKSYIDQHPQAPRGEIRLSFIVTSLGKMENFENIKKANTPLFEEAVRIVKNGDSWDPGLKNGQKVPDKIMLVVRFE